MTCFRNTGADFAVGSPETCTGVDVGVELVREVGSTLDHLRAGRGGPSVDEVSTVPPWIVRELSPSERENDEVTWE